MTTKWNRLRRRRLAVEPAWQRLVRPALLGALRFRMRQGLPHEHGLPGAEGGLPVLGGPPEAAA